MMGGGAGHACRKVSHDSRASSGGQGLGHSSLGQSGHEGSHGAARRERGCGSLSSRAVAQLVSIFPKLH